MDELKKQLELLNPAVLSGMSAIYRSSEACDCDACSGCDTGCDSGGCYGCDCYY